MIFVENNLEKYFWSNCFFRNNSVSYKYSSEISVKNSGGGLLSPYKKNVFFLPILIDFFITSRNMFFRTVVLRNNIFFWTNVKLGANLKFLRKKYHLFTHFLPKDARQAWFRAKRCRSPSFACPRPSSFCRSGIVLETEKKVDKKKGITTTTTFFVPPYFLCKC
jgi:hypothetical protein